MTNRKKWKWGVIFSSDNLSIEDLANYSRMAEHQQSFTQKNGKDGSNWWIHKAPDGSWCRE